MSAISKPEAKRLADYIVPDFLIDTVDLHFTLRSENTSVINTMTVRRNGEHDRALELDGEGLTLLSVKIDQEQVEAQSTVDGLVIATDKDQFTLEIETECNPSANTSLEGLYLSAGTYCTQCEAEGFRKITYFLDRPDVMSIYDVTIVAEKSAYPYLLSNGNCIDSGDLENGYHWVKWQDPYRKPCYLFALVAGDFDLVEDSYITKSGRNVALQLFVDKGNAYRGQHALDSLKKSMAWDERVFNLEYDLDIYMIVAVDFFNMGAMENKGLNVFNSKYVLADPKSATDEDYFNIESIIAHEYFHNWTGNRVTCRDWFQLSLKEGLTVFRDQQFSSDMSSPISNRINQIKVIREHQFAEDAGPMSHPIRPEEVIEMNNFYTVTVYDKGAEVIRMMHTMLGQPGFAKGMALYFERHDGQAVTCDDFVNAMQDANGVDLSLFKRWYSQAGTPELVITEQYDPKSQRYQVNIKQCHRATANQTIKQDLHIPLSYEILDVSSKSEVLKEGVLDFTENEKDIVIEGCKEKPLPVFLRNFSAPVKLVFEQQEDELLQVMLNSTDGVARWDASQRLYSKLIWQQVDNSDEDVSGFIQDIATELTIDKDADYSLLSELLTLPTFETLVEQRTSIDIDSLLLARKNVEGLLSKALQPQMTHLYHAIKPRDYRYETVEAQKRRIRNLCLWHMANASDGRAIELETHYNSADNMTDRLAVLKALRDTNIPLFDTYMANFENEWRDDVLVLDKWFALHAGANREDILSILPLLTSHRKFSFDNPNRVRSVVGTFAFYNVENFHKKDGSGYRYVADNIIQLNNINPQVAARIITPLLNWSRFDQSRQEQLRLQLARIAETENLSKDLYEKVSKSLNQG